MFTMTQNLQIAHQIQADRMSHAERHRRFRRSRRSADEQASRAVGELPANVVALRSQSQGTAVATRVA
jgi:hypothetical protein